MARTLNWDIGSFSGQTAIFFPRDPGACASWAPLSGEYDQFRVTGMSVTIGFPCYAEVPPTGVPVPHMCSVLYDNDAITTTGFSFAGSIEKSTRVLMEASGLQKVRYKLPKMMVSPIPPATNYLSTDWIDCLNHAALAGGIVCLVDSLSTSGTAVINARIVVELEVEFKYRL